MERDYKLFMERFHELLEDFDLEDVCIFDPNSKSLKNLEGISFNGKSLQITSEKWTEEE